MDSTAKLLKEIIEREGPDYLMRSPAKVYKEILKNKTTDKRTAAALYHTLVMDIPALASRQVSNEEISKTIQKDCFFKKTISDKLANLYTDLYSNENREEWENKNLAGLKAFLEKEWEFEWKGTAQWDAGQAYVECSYEAVIVISAEEETLNDAGLREMLQNNPFLDEEAIADYVEKSLCDYLDKEFEEYCTVDDYYPPVAEDFEAKEYTADWCREHGFTLVSFEGKGDTGDYEPKMSSHYW